MSSGKFVFVNRYFFPDESATSQMLSDLAFHLAGEGRRVEIVTGRFLHEQGRGRLPRFEEVHGVRVHRIWSTDLGRHRLLGRALDYLTFYMSAAFALWRLASSATTIIAKTDPPLVSIIAAVVAKLRRARLVNWIQDLFPEVAHSLGVSTIRGPVLWSLLHARNGSLRAAATNVVIGELMRQRLSAQGVDPERIHIIHNWADGAAIVPVPPSQNTLRSAWGLSDRFVVGYSGNLGRAHEFTTILEAANLLRHRDDIAFLFIGGGAQKTAVEAASRAKALPNVIFMPYQPRDNLGKSLTVADAHLVTLNPALEGAIVPSKFYGIVAAGRPVLFVGDTSGEIARMVDANDCGYSVKSGAAGELATHICALADHPSTAHRLGRRAREAFEGSYDRPHALRSWSVLLGGSS